LNLGYKMPDPNNIILPEYKLAIMCVPKNANTALKWSLIRTFDLSANDKPHSPDLFQYVSKEYILDQKSWMKFAVIRHPVNRVVSCWKEKVTNREELFSGFKKHKGIKLNQSFEQFVDIICKIPDKKADLHFRSQYWHLFADDTFVPNFWADIKKLSQRWNEIKDRIKDFCGLELSDLTWENTTDYIKEWPNIDSETLNKIKERYYLDFERLGYDA